MAGASSIELEDVFASNDRSVDDAVLEFGFRELGIPAGCTCEVEPCFCGGAERIGDSIQPFTTGAFPGGVAFTPVSISGGIGRDLFEFNQGRQLDRQRSAAANGDAIFGAAIFGFIAFVLLRQVI